MLNKPEKRMRRFLTLRRMKELSISMLREGCGATNPDRDGDKKRNGQATITVPRELFEDLLEDAMELKGERHWWKDELLNYQRDYEQLSKRIDEGRRLRDLK
jgi:hypothetical protein